MGPGAEGRARGAGVAMKDPTKKPPKKNFARINSVKLGGGPHGDNVGPHTCKGCGTVIRASSSGPCSTRAWPTRVLTIRPSGESAAFPSPGALEDSLWSTCSLKSRPTRP